jgi:hypothetical protein
MKKALLLAITLLLSVCAASAQTTTSTATTTQKWTTGWDNFTEPLDLVHSNVMWSVSTARKLTVTFNLMHAQPSKLYQVGAHIICTTFPATFGQFPTSNGGGSCPMITKQGVTRGVVAIEMGVVTTDLHGNGTFKVVVGPITSGTYDLEFTVRNGAGCNLIGGGGNAGCAIDFQSPGPFGTTATVVVP